MVTIIGNNTPFSSQNYTQVFSVILGFPLKEINCNTLFQRTCLRLRPFFRLLPDSKFIFFVTFDCKLPIWNGPRIFLCTCKMPITGNFEFCSHDENMQYHNGFGNFKFISYLWFYTLLEYELHRSVNQV